MNAHAFISHRMFVAALGPGANGATRSSRPERIIDIGHDGAAKGRSTLTVGAGRAWTALAASPLLTAAVVNGFRTSGA